MVKQVLVISSYRWKNQVQAVKVVDQLVKGKAEQVNKERD